MVSIAAQLSNGSGEVLDTQTLDGMAVRIAPKEARSVTFRVNAAVRGPRADVYRVDVCQGERHCSRAFVLVSRDGALRAEEPFTVEGYLRSFGRGPKEFETLLAHSRAERLSMEHMSDEDYVQYCYLWLLGRDADPEGMSDYVSALGRGLKRAEVITRIYGSEESANFRRLASPAVSGSPAYPFSAAHDRMRSALGALDPDEGLRAAGHNLSWLRLG